MCFFDVSRLTPPPSALPPAVVQVGARVLTGPHAGLADAAKGTVPVWTPATAEAFAAYGEVDGDGACAVRPGSGFSELL